MEHFFSVAKENGLTEDEIGAVQSITMGVSAGRIKAQFEQVRENAADDLCSSTQDKKEETDGLKEFVRDTAETAGKEDTSGHFNAMSWMDLELEDNPGLFDDFFDIPWKNLSDAEKAKRSADIRKVL